MAAIFFGKNFISGKYRIITCTPFSEDLLELQVKLTGFISQDPMAKKEEKESKGFFPWLAFGGPLKVKTPQNHPAPATIVAARNKNHLILEPSQVSVDYNSQLGLGSFGTVYKGSYMGKPCAVKIFNTGVVKGDIAREAEVTSLIHHHENIVQVYGLWYEESEDGNNFLDGQPALVMELCSTNLKSYLDGKKKNPHDTHSLKDKLTILYQVTSAMIYLHSRRIVHGDLSAANILLRISGQQPSQVLTAKVGDFGQALILNPETLKHLPKDHGKDDIMPPEVLKGDIVTLTIAVDVFSFGCLVPYVATCVYPKPALVGSEFVRRKHCLRFVPETQRRLLLPLMEKCLADKPHLRGTFEDIRAMLGPLIKTFVEGTYSEAEEEKIHEIEKLKGNLLKYEGILKSLQEEKEANKVSYHELEKENKLLETTNKLLNDDLDASRSTVSQLEETVRQRDVAIKDANDSLALLDAQLKDEQRAAEEEKTSLRTRLMKAEELLEDTKDQLAKNQKDFRSAQNMISQYEIDLKGVKGQLEGKGTKVKELEHSVQNRERKLKTEEQKTADAWKEVDVLKAQLKRQEQHVNSLGRQLTDAKTKADTAERQWRQLDGQLRTAHFGIANLEKSEKYLKSELESIKGERDEYLQGMEKLVARNAELEKDVKVAVEELSITKEASTRKTRELNALMVKYEDVQENNELLKKNEEEIERLNHELQQSKAGHSKVVSDWENEKKNVSRLEEEVEHLRTELQHRKESQSQHLKDKDKMRRDNYELRESLERHLRLIEQKDRTIKTLQDERKKHIQSLQAMEERQRELTIRLNKQTKHFKQKETEWRSEVERITRTFEPGLSILKTEHEDLQRKVVSSKEVIRQKEQEIIELKRSKDTLSVEVEEKERELAKLKKKLKAEIACREENQQRMKEYKATSEKMERLAGTLQSELSELTQLFTEQEASATAKQEELKEMLEIANKEKIAFEEQKEQEGRIQEELKKQLDKQRERWESEVSKASKFTERIHSLEIDLKKECVHSIKLQAQLDSVDRKVSSMKLEISCLEEENTQLKLARKLFDLEKANFEAYRSTSMETEESTATFLTQLEDDYKMLSEKCDTYKVERDRMCEEKENLLAKLDQLKKKIETLEDQMRQLIAEKASLKDKSDRWRNDNSELKIECDRSKSELLRLNQERRSLLTQQQELERERDKWMKECKVLKELSSQRMVSSSSEEPVDLEDLERQEDRKRKVGQMQTDIDRLKELAGSMADGSDSVDPNMSSTESDN